jgi:hypothetical protein
MRNYIMPLPFVSNTGEKYNNAFFQLICGYHILFIFLFLFHSTSNYILQTYRKNINTGLFEMFHNIFIF